jgi:hypothetical protein
MMDPALAVRFNEENIMSNKVSAITGVFDDTTGALKSISRDCGGASTGTPTPIAAISPAQQAAIDAGGSAVVVNASGVLVDKNLSPVSGVKFTLAGGGDAALGDSITQQDNDNSGQVTGNGWFEWVCLLSGYRFRRVRNAGVAGNTLEQMLARFDTDVAPYAPARVWLAGGTNNLSATGFPAASMATFKAIVQKTLSIGAEPIICAIPPRSDSSANNARLWNIWLERYALINGYRFVNGWRTLTSSSGTWVSGASGDLIHPYQSTAYAAAVDILTQIQYPTYAPLLICNNAPANSIITNNLFVTDTNSDGTPDGWVHYGATGTSVSLVAAESNTGNWLTVTSSSGAGLHITERGIGASGNFSPGDVLSFSCRVKTSGIDANYRPAIKLDFVGASSSAYVLKEPQVAFAGVICVEKTVPAGCTQINIDIISNGSATPFNGVISVAQMDIRNLTTLGIISI